MGKRTTIETEQQPSGKEIRTPAASTIKVFNSTFDDVKITIDEANDELKTAATEAKQKHLHLGAFKVAKGLFDSLKKAKNESIAAEKLAKWLANFDRLREYFKLDELANLQGRMFAEGEIGTPPRGSDEDGEPDMRPDYMRQPGASAADQKPNPVADLAAKAGAKPHDPTDQVGRGKPKLN